MGKAGKAENNLNVHQYPKDKLECSHVLWDGTEQ